MLIVCPGCATSYRIDAEALGPVGRTVRCARCRSTWFAAAAIDTLSAEPEIVAEGAPSERGREQRQADGAPIDAGAAGESLHDPSPLPAAEDTAIARVAEGAQAEPRQGAGEAASTSEPASAPIVEAPPLVPAAGIAPPAGDPPAEPEDIESFAARRERLQARRRQRRRTSRWAAALLVLFAVNVALIGGREDVVRYLPQTAPLFAALGLPVNLRHLVFRNMRVVREVEQGVPVIAVEGMIVSTGNEPVEVPRLRFAARDAAGQEIYTWALQPDRSVLAPGETLAFVSRLASPPKEVRDVAVRFFTARDAVAK
jgi:predicted Zn finger-like uncharacterized protein